jgi:hypothetical protein
MLCKGERQRRKFPKGLDRQQPFRNEVWCSQDNLERWKLEDREIEARGLLMLLRHFRISPKAPDCWRKLSLELARDRFAYFRRDRAKKGRKSSWDLHGFARLLRRVADARAGGTSIDVALKKVQQEHYPRVTVRSLRNRLGEAMRHKTLMLWLEDTRAVPPVPRAVLNVASKKRVEQLWRSFSSEPDGIVGRIEPDPNSRDGVVVVFDDDQ